MMREIRFNQAINEALNEEMARDNSVFIIGEDIGEHWGGPFGQFNGLAEKYGTKRVRETPISETAILGAAIGTAATGMRPVAAMMFVDFLGVTGDELLNQIQMRYMFGGKIKLPLTIIATSGAGASAAAQHSKSLYGWLMNVQGLKIVAPSTPYDAKGLLKEAIREDNPVVFLAHKMLGGLVGDVPESDFTVPLGKAGIKREGKDITVVALSLMVHRALAGAQKLQQKGISIEVIDARTVKPFDKETIFESVKKTGRLVIMDEEPVTGSWASEVAATVTENLFDYLDAPIKRVCAPDTPIPFSPVLEKYWMPSEAALIQAIEDIL
jgi:pyruvate/2-oxoglutarate/acetoin dehydrogenase E1 component